MSSGRQTLADRVNYESPLERALDRAEMYHERNAAMDAGGDVKALDTGHGLPAASAGPAHPLIAQMEKDLGISYFFTGGAAQLEVRTVSGPYRIDEYDGSEYIVTADSLWG